MKRYIGDSVYVDIDGYGRVVLTTNNGMGDSNVIIMESAVLTQFLDYIEQARKAESEKLEDRELPEDTGDQRDEVDHHARFLSPQSDPLPARKAES